MKADNKQLIIDFLIKNVDKIPWVRKDGCGIREFYTTIGTHSFIVRSTIKEGNFLSCTTPTNSLGKSIDSKDYPSVKTLFNKIFDNNIKKSEDDFWKSVFKDISSVELND